MHCHCVILLFSWAVYFLRFCLWSMAVCFYFLSWSFLFELLIVLSVTNFLFGICSVNSLVDSFLAFYMRNYTCWSYFSKSFLDWSFRYFLSSGISSPICTGKYAQASLYSCLLKTSSVVNCCCELLELSVYGMITPWRIWLTKPWIADLLAHSDYLLCTHALIIGITSSSASASTAICLLIRFPSRLKVTFFFSTFGNFLVVRGFILYLWETLTLYHFV